MRPTSFAAVAALAAVAAGATALPAGAAPPGPVAAKTLGTKIRLGPSQFGRVLFDSRDQVVYMFDKESSTKPRCYGTCAKAWPPVLTKAKPRAGDGVDSDLLGTTERKDGKLQLTYRDHPLYYYANEGPKQVFCHNVDQFGGLWLVLNSRGKPRG